MYAMATISRPSIPLYVYIYIHMYIYINIYVSVHKNCQLCARKVQSPREHEYLAHLNQAPQARLRQREAADLAYGYRSVLQPTS